MINGTRYRLTVEINRQADLAREIARGQAQITNGGKRLLAPSDDPSAAARISEFGRAQADEAAWLRNVDAAIAIGDRADTALTSVGALLERANEIMVAAANGTLSDQNRANYATELRSLATDIATLSQSLDARGQPLFSAGDPLRIPIQAGVSVAPVTTRSAIFDGVPVGAGPTDISGILNAAADALGEPDPAARQAAVAASLGAVGAAVEHVNTQRGEHGLRLARLDDMRERLLTSKLQIEEQRSALESTDVPALIAKLESQRLTLQAAQAIFARVNQTSLFDLLR